MWLRVVTPYTKNWISIDGGNQIDIEIAARQREQVNLMWPSPSTFANWFQVGWWCVIHHSITWVKAGTFTLTPRQLSLTFGVVQDGT